MQPQLQVIAVDPQGRWRSEDFDFDTGFTPGGPGRWRVILTVTSRVEVCARIVVGLQLPAADPHWLIPGLFYGENRPQACDRRFPRFEMGAHDPNGMVSDHWSFRADRAATPVVFGWGDDGGAALATTERSPLGLSGLGFAHRIVAESGAEPGAEADGEGQVSAEGAGTGGQGWAAVHLSFPYVEEPVTYYGSGRPKPASGEYASFGAGQSVQLAFDLFTFGPDRHAYAPILRQIWTESVDSGAHPLRPWMDTAQAADLTGYGLLRWHYDPNPGVLLETAAFDREISIEGTPPDRQAMHVGWIGGVPWAYALLRHGHRVGEGEALAAGRRVIDFIAANLSPSGTFYGVWYRDHGWKGSWTPLVAGVHARTVGEATYFLLRAIELEQSRGVDHPDWVAAAASNLTAMVGRQRWDGNLGAVHRMDTGEVVSWRGASGLIWIPALVLAARLAADGLFGASAQRGTMDGIVRKLFGDQVPDSRSPLDPVVLSRAAALAGTYYARFVSAEFICGAPEDVDLAPTSEDGYSAVMAYMALHRAGIAVPPVPDPEDQKLPSLFGFIAKRLPDDAPPLQPDTTVPPLPEGWDAGGWLGIARQAADWMLTFRYSYNVHFDAHTMLGQYDFASRGADQASPSNQHLHNYGLICGGDLFELAEAVGDQYYAERASETLACFRQFIARQDGDFNAYRGMVTERYYQTECFQPKGMLHTLSHAWCLGATLLACEEELDAGR